jgi:protein disulfide-isomerase A6
VAAGGQTGEAIAEFGLSMLGKEVNTRISGKKEKKTSSSSSSGKDEVVVLTDDNFDQLVMKSKDIWMVEFYAPWCGHCKSLEPEYKEAASKLKGAAKLGKVDATVHKRLNDRFDIKGFPTLKIWDYGLDAKKDSKAIDY